MIDEAFHPFQDKTQAHASFQRNRQVNTAGRSPAALSSLQRAAPLKNKTNRLFSIEKAMDREEREFPAVHTSVTYPTVWSPLTPKW